MTNLKGIFMQIGT